MNGSDTILLLRRLLLAVILLGMSGTIAELYLLEHYEEAWQVVPLVALVLGAALTLAVLARPTPGTLRFLRLLFAAFVGVGVLGIWRHYVGNTEFELERHPDLAGLRLFWESLRGATPALAPGTMVQIGLFGLVALFRHPAG